MKKIGPVKAHIPKTELEPARYVRIGYAFEDDRGRFVVKLDSLPIDKGWLGWLNVYPEDEESSGV